MATAKKVNYKQKPTYKPSQKKRSYEKEDY
jgi:hypothetical protein